MFLNRIILLVCTMTGLAASAATPIEFDPIKARPLSRIPAENSRANSPKLLTADGQQLYANLWYKGAWDSQAPSYGIYSFPMVEGNPAGFDAVVKDPRLCGNAGAVYANGKYFVATSEEVNAPNGGYVVMSMKFYLFDTLTWKATEIPNADEEFKAMDMAYDPMTDKVYGCFVKRGVNGYYYFGTLDINTGHVTMIRNYGQDSAYAFTGVAVSGSGTVYAINAAGSLYSLDKTTGVASLIGETGLPNQYMTSATIDPVSGKIYYALNSDLMTGMYEINPVNAVAKRLYSFQDQESVAGMYLPEAAPDPNAPAATTDLTATFTDGSLSGKVAFTAPVLTYGGSALSGSLTYTLKANGNTVTTGTAKAGSYVERELTVKGAGEYSFSVTFSNAKGDGATARAGLYIGPDMPLPPTDVVLTLASDGSMSLSWTPSVSAHGGWLDPAALKYVVTRLDGSQAGETAATQFSEPVPDPSTRTRNVYSVAARSGSFTSEATGSNTVFAGSYPTPHIETFDSRDALEDYLVDDGDGDGKCWLWQDGQLHSSICLERQVDDLVMLPPVTLERGMSYRVSIRAKATRSPLKVYPERIAVWAGYARSRQDMNIGVIAPTDVTTDQYATLSGLFTPSQSGPCYFAVQACSDPDNYYLWIDDFTVSEPVRSDVPNPVEGLIVTPGADGALSATIKCTLPTTVMTGAELTGITGVEIYRDNALLKTHPGQPGGELAFTDREVQNGTHTYGVAVIAPSGSSLRESVEVYVGVHEPMAVTGLTAVRGEHDGQMRLEWTAPDKDVEGVSLQDVTYRVTRYDRAETVVADGLTSPTFTDDITQPGGGQEFVQYAVEAVNIAGSSKTAWSNTTTYGRLLPAPMHESFAEGFATQEFVVERDDDNASWTVTNPASNPGISDQDADGGLLRFTGVITGAWANFISGSYSLQGLDNPALVFYFLYPKGSDSVLSVTLTAQKDGRLLSTTVAVAPDPVLEGWQRCIIPIEGSPESIQFTFSGINNGEYATSIFVDNIALIDLPTPNITLNTLHGPAVVEANQPFSVTAYVENSGTDAVDADVALYLNDEVVESKTVALEAGNRAAVEFEQTLSAVNPEQLIYHAEATAPGDQVDSDNRSIDLSVGVRHNIYPAPRTAHAKTGTDGKPVLTWQAPDLGPAEPQRVTDGGEGYVAFSTGLPNSVLANDYMGLWTSVDADGLYTLGVGHNDVAIPNASIPKAFMVFNGSAANMDGQVWATHSGKSMFVAFAAIADSGQGNDDWLISPLLPGTAQQVSLWARSATDLYGLESMQILYSSKGIDPKDFKQLKAVKGVPADWTEYSIDLPDGAQYFAIRCTSSNLFALCVDDITFTQAGLHGMGVALEGYNVYRDYKLMAKVEPGTTEWADSSVADKGTPYHVTALYNVGESRPSNEASLDMSGIDGVAAGEAVVTTHPGEIVVSVPGQEVAIYLPDGRKVASGRAAAYSVAPGAYIVTVGAQAFKVIVP